MTQAHAHARDAPADGPITSRHLQGNSIATSRDASICQYDADAREKCDARSWYSVQLGYRQSSAASTSGIITANRTKLKRHCSAPFSVFSRAPHTGSDFPSEHMTSWNASRRLQLNSDTSAIASFGSHANLRKIASLRTRLSPPYPIQFILWKRCATSVSGRSLS